MSIQHPSAISNRLRLRPPQRDSVEFLARVCEIVSLSKAGVSAQALETIRFEFETSKTSNGNGVEKARNFKLVNG